MGHLADVIPLPSPMVGRRATIQRDGSKKRTCRCMIPLVKNCVCINNLTYYGAYGTEGEHRT